MQNFVKCFFKKIRAYAILTVARSLRWRFPKKLDGLLTETKSFAAYSPRCDVHHATNEQVDIGLFCRRAVGIGAEEDHLERCEYAHDVVTCGLNIFPAHYAYVPPLTELLLDFHTNSDVEDKRFT